MELWIRSQDKKRLTKIEDVYMVEDFYKKDNILSFPKYYIGNTLVGHLGIYKTKERALEVLDEIQGLFMNKEITNTELTKDGLTMYSKQPTSIVYQMPEE